MSIHPLITAVSKNIRPLIGASPRHFLLACSGGADSTALLLALHYLRPLLSYRLSVITVNHNIRSAEESAADSAFVAGLCKQLEPPVFCVTEELPAGAVSRCAHERKRGIEDAARALRYRLFEKTAADIGADFIVTAHNQSDVYETVLMRLFQGGGTASLRTMSVRRGRYVRPLITVNRSSIEAFLRQQDVTWCEDATNVQEVYLRNRIRRILTPALSAAFGGWHTGLDKTLQRINLDCSFCEAALESARAAFGTAADWQECRHGAIAVSASFFDSLHPALRLRLLEQACIKLGIEKRVPFGIFFRLTSESTQVNISAAGPIRMERRGIRILFFNTETYLALYRQKAYLLTVEQCGVYPYPLGLLEVYESSGGFFVRDKEDDTGGVGPFMLPVTIRSRRGGDRIQMSTGGFKEVKKILNEWNVDSLARALLPIIIENNRARACMCAQETGRIRALYGRLLGYRNRFVEEE